LPNVAVSHSLLSWFQIGMDVAISIFGLFANALQWLLFLGKQWRDEQGDQMWLWK
jgi:hypothetical protein